MTSRRSRIPLAALTALLLGGACSRSESPAAPDSEPLAQIPGTAVPRGLSRRAAAAYRFLLETDSYDGVESYPTRDPSLNSLALFTLWDEGAGAELFEGLAREAGLHGKLFALAGLLAESPERYAAVVDDLTAAGVVFDPLVGEMCVSRLLVPVEEVRPWIARLPDRYADWRASGPR